MAKRRNLAFYKPDKSKWTLEEFKNILKYTGAIPSLGGYTTEEAIKKYVADMTKDYIYDNGQITSDFMHSWAEQRISKCTKVNYNELFNQPKLKIYKIKGK